MRLKEALHGISAAKYFDICGYSYRTLFKYRDYQFHELPKDFQDGILVLAFKIYEVSEMVYSYELDLVSKHIKQVGLKKKTFFDACDINDSFHITLGLKINREARLIAIKLQLIKTITRLIRFANSKHS